MELYKLNNVSLMGGIGSGCLPILITLPIWSGLYNAILLSNEISSSDFMGINLGVTILPNCPCDNGSLLCSISSQPNGNGRRNEKQSRSMNYILPVMMFLMTFQSPAGVGYFTSSSQRSSKFYNHGFKILIFVQKLRLKSTKN